MDPKFILHDKYFSNRLSIDKYAYISKKFLHINIKVNIEHEWGKMFAYHHNIIYACSIYSLI